jgi:hypothetical protein
VIFLRAYVRYCCVAVSMTVMWLSFLAAAMGQSTSKTTGIRPVDDARLRAAGIRRLDGRHLVLYTDLRGDPEVDRLPAVFDQAVPQWASYFGVEESKTRNWQARGFLIKDRQRFEALGLMPGPGDDQFVNGISRGAQLWLYDQPTVYYRRHLLLHEGTHAFMASMLGGCGPGWFMEGTAELMATHRLDERSGQLTLRIMPSDRDEVPMLGRIELIRDAREEGHTLGLSAVMQIDNRRLLENESYAWCWAACIFLDSQPRYRERFRSLRRHVEDSHFNDILRRDFEDDWDDLNHEWQAFVSSLDHGFDSERMAIDFRRGEPLRRGERKPVEIDVARGWQSTRVRLDAGKSYRLSGSGRFQIAEETSADGKKLAWPCEAGGVTIEYYAGRPLGMLLGAIVPTRFAPASSDAAGGSGDAGQDGIAANFFRPIEVGLGTTIESPVSGTLYLRVNDAPGRLRDNRGTLTVIVEEVSARDK